MSYYDGFILAVPTANKQKFIDHASHADPVFLEHGATRVFECWEDDVPKGTVTDFRKAVQAKDDESVVFSWIEYPDKATRHKAGEWMMSEGMKDPRMDQEKNPMPFDGKRMIYAGFAPFLEQGERGGEIGYVDGFVLPVLPGKKDAYVAMAEEAATKFKSYGALCDSESWGDDITDGKVTDFKRAVKAEDGETIVFSFLGWPDKATRDAGWAKMMEEGEPPAEMPFDGKRMFWGGFQPVVTLG